MKVVYKNQKRETRSYFGFVIMCAMLLSATFIISAFQKPEEKTYPVKLTIQEWNVVLSVIDNSNSPHQTVVAASKAIVEQIKVPYEADQKKLQDSVNKIQKPKG